MSRLPIPPTDPVAPPEVDEGDGMPDRPPMRPWGRHVVPGWETDVFRALNDLPDVLRWPLWPIMQLGNLSMLSVGAVIAYLARVYFGAHLPLDVLAGAGIGILCGLLASAIIGTAAPNRGERVG